VFAERGRQAGAGFNVAPDVGQQFGHAGVGAAAPHDVECLQQGHTGLHHRGQLAREDGDVFLFDGAATRGAALFDLLHQDALAAQGGADQGLATGAHFAPHDLAVAVFAFPFEDELLRFLGRCRGHVSELRVGFGGLIRW
jgi:hypothetical protein